MATSKRNIKDLKNIKANTTALGYNAITTTGRRKQTSIISVKPERTSLSPVQRTQLIAKTKDIVRNSPVANWMLNKYLDYTTRFYFQAKTADVEANQRIESEFYKWAQARNCDIRGMHTLEGILRLFGAGKAVDGDALIQLLDGYKLQLVESSRIAKIVSDANGKEVKEATLCTDDGLLLDDYGKIVKFCISKYLANSQVGGQFQQVHETMLDAENCIFDGNFIRAEQVRGISKFASCVDTLLDIREASEAQLVKAKLHAMLGFAIMSESATSGFGERTETDETTGTERYKFDVPNTMKLELDPGDKVDTLESKTPSIEYQQYIDQQIRHALSAFGIPYCFFDSRQSSYSANKQDRAEFQLSIKYEREKNRIALERITDWVLPIILKKAGVNIPVEEFRYEWIEEGEPWLDETKEVTAATSRIAAGLSSRTFEAKRHGRDFADIIAELEAEEAVIKRANITITTGAPGQTTVNENGMQSPDSEDSEDSEDIDNKGNNEVKSNE